MPRPREMITAVGEWRRVGTGPGGATRGGEGERGGGRRAGFGEGRDGRGCVWKGRWGKGYGWGWGVGEVEKEMGVGREGKSRGEGVEEDGIVLCLRCASAGRGAGRVGCEYGVAASIVLVLTGALYPSCALLYVLSVYQVARSIIATALSLRG